MTLDAINILIGVAALGIALILWLLLDALRPWREAVERAVPGPVAHPLRCVSRELRLLPLVFGFGALSRFAIASHIEPLRIACASATFAVTLLALFHLVRALACVRRAVRA